MKTIPVILDDSVVAQIRRTGTGSTLIIQHGWTGSVQDWLGLIKPMSEHLTCYGWDMRPYHAENGTVERMAEDLDTVIRTLALDRPVLLGHSMGALVAWEYIRQFGCSALRKLIIIDQSPKVLTDEDWSLGLFGHFTQQDNAEFIQKLESDFVATVMDLVASGKILTAPQKQALLQDELVMLRLKRLRTFNPRAWINSWKSFIEKDYRSVLERITIPTLLIYGEKSNYYGSAVARYIAGKIPNTDLRIYPDAGHSPHQEYPRRFVEDLVDFVCDGYNDQ